MGLETGEWCRCRSLSLTPPASLRSHGSRPRPTRHKYIKALLSVFTTFVALFMIEILPRVLNMDCKWPKLAFCSEIHLFYSFER